MHLIIGYGRRAMNEEFIVIDEAGDVPDEVWTTPLPHIKRREDKKRHILQHALGLSRNPNGAMYRNHFCTGPGSKDYELCVELVNEGYMVNHGSSELTGGDELFVVTEKGKSLVAPFVNITPADADEWNKWKKENDHLVMTKDS